MVATRRKGTLMLLSRLSKTAMRATPESEMGMSIRHFSALHSISGAMPQQQLAETLCIDANNTVLILNELETLGWVRRERDPMIAAAISWSSPTKGSAAYRRAQEARDVVEDEVLGPLSATNVNICMTCWPRPSATDRGDAMDKSATPKWTDAPAEHDYPAASSYLRLLTSSESAEALATLMSQATTVLHPVKDILRAARLPLLPADDPEVAKDLKKVKDGTALSPVLLVRGDLDSGRPLQIADGYHRVCASYHLSEDTEIPCRLVDPPAGGE